MNVMYSIFFHILDNLLQAHVTLVFSLFLLSLVEQLCSMSNVFFFHCFMTFLLTRRTTIRYFLEMTNSIIVPKPNDGY